MKKLNGWQRIGVVLSVLWMVGASLYVQTDRTDRAYKFANSMMSLCLDMVSPSPKDCTSDYSHNVKIALNPFWPDAVILAIVPIPITWLLVYIIIGIVRWVRAGFVNNKMKGS
jgi:hypothetical protein